MEERASLHIAHRGLASKPYERGGNKLENLGLAREGKEMTMAIRARIAGEGNKAVCGSTHAESLIDRKGFLYGDL